MTALETGQQIVATSSAYPGREFRGDVTVIDSRVDVVTRAIKVRAEIPNPDGFIKPGTLMTVVVATNERQSLTVPEASLVPVADQQFVFRIGSDNVVERVEVIIGGRRVGVAEILSGLGEGDRVVTSGTLRMRDGAVVRVKGDPRCQALRAVGQPGKEKRHDSFRRFSKAPSLRSGDKYAARGLRYCRLPFLAGS